ncbi:MAG: type II toxin-antitoxin system VapC family toxin [Pseudonocardia sp.]|nr:type II toxin-antitoxin system VapC family toxin [Pseudonocardia sp.]
MIYLDSCAAVKLIREEAESDALQSWLDVRPEELVATSELALAEVVRVVRRSNHTDQGALVDPDRLRAELDGAHAVLGGLALVTLDRETLERAAALEAPMVRTLDAIHLVSALEWPAESVEFVTYDRRLATAVENAGMSVISPS